MVSAKPLICGVLTIIVLVCCPAAFSQESEKAVIFFLEGELSQTMLHTLQRSIDKALKTDAKFLIVEIDTPGGEISLMERLRDRLFDASIKEGLETVAFINDAADSAGALVSMACNQIYMSPLAHMGSATPVAINPLGPLAPMIPTQQGQEDMLNKMKSQARAIFRATASETGRSPELAEAMVDPDIELLIARVNGQEEIMNRQQFMDKSQLLGKDNVEEIRIICGHGELLNMTAREALEWGFIEGIPDSREMLLDEFLNISSENLVKITPSWSEKLVQHIESIQFLLLIAGLILLYVEFQMPGFGIPGILGLACLAILFFGKWLVGLAEFSELIMIVLGLGLIGVEIFVIPGTFVAGILGAILVGAGLLLSFQPFIIPDSQWQVEMLKDNIFYFSASLVAVAVISLTLSRFLPKTSLFQKIALDSGAAPGALHGSAGAIDEVRPDIRIKVGDQGKVYSTLRPAGTVIFNDTQIDAQSEGGFIDKGVEVEVVRISGNFIFVRQCKGTQT